MLAEGYHDKDQNAFFVHALAHPPPEPRDISKYKPADNRSVLGHNDIYGIPQEVSYVKKFLH